jgi:signal transduction histidine kinase
VSLTAAPRNGGVCITVADEGEGIAEEHLPRLFDRFYRAEASRAAKGGHSGAGLGLALVKTIMEIHGGTVTVESGAGKGAVFRLEFPVAVNVRKG